MIILICVFVILIGIIICYIANEVDKIHNDVLRIRNYLDEVKYTFEMSANRIRNVEEKVKDLPDLYSSLDAKKNFIDGLNHKPDPSRPGPTPNNTHVISPYKCPKCGWYLIIDNDAYPSKQRFYCQNCDYEEDLKKLKEKEKGKAHDRN